MRPAPSATEPFKHDVFNSLVESPEDFLGLLSYSLYKRHKIEWMQTHSNEHFETFKKLACTSTQLTMYKNEAEQMFKNIVDLALEQYGQEMRESIQESEIVASIDRLKPKLSSVIGNHMIGGFCSVLAALVFYGIFALYSAYQASGGVESSAKKAVQSYLEPPLVMSEPTEAVSVEGAAPSFAD
jgi:hypothetical protein